MHIGDLATCTAQPHNDQGRIPVALDHGGQIVSRLLANLSGTIGRHLTSTLRLIPGGGMCAAGIHQNGETKHQPTPPPGYDCPPLQLMTCPVMKLASSDARKAIAAACSSGSPRRRSAC